MYVIVDKLEEEADIAVACFGPAGNIHTNLVVDNDDDRRVKERGRAALDILFNWL